MPLGVRPATPHDQEAVAALLRASYGTLLAGHYDDEVLAPALEFLTKPHPDLLASGTYYVADFAGLGLAGCGGWSRTPPGGSSTAADAATGHIRHFATHPDAVRQGVGRLLMERCIGDARETGVERFSCLSTRQAVPFYRACGFREVGPFAVALAPGVALPGIALELALSSEARPP